MLVNNLLKKLISLTKNKLRLWSYLTGNFSLTSSMFHGAGNFFSIKLSIFYIFCLSLLPCPPID
jgi:hypothetical protein